MKPYNVDITWHLKDEIEQYTLIMVQMGYIFNSHDTVYKYSFYEKPTITIIIIWASISHACKYNI